MTSQPVVAELRRGRALLLGTLSGISGLVLLGVFLLIAATGQMEGQELVLSLCLAASLLGISAHHIGLALRRPVALRIDASGISGYFAEPAVWPEIMEIDAWQGSKGRRYLGFAFLNPDIILGRQSAWRRFSNWSRNPGFGYRYQIVISEDLLQDYGVDALAAQARAFHRAA